MFCQDYQLHSHRFPTGGFSHSSGLEAALKVNLIHDSESLKEFMLCCLENAGSFLMPFVKESHQQYMDVPSLVELDQLCEACTSNHVAKRASTRQGRSLLDTSTKVFNKPSLEALDNKLPHRHLPVVFGTVCASLNVSLHSACVAFLYMTVRTVLASAVRLDKVGPIEAQKIQTDIQTEIPVVLERYKQVLSEDARLIYPHIDIIQNVHDTMFTKLFYS